MKESIYRNHPNLSKRQLSHTLLIQVQIMSGKNGSQSNFDLETMNQESSKAYNDKVLESCPYCARTFLPDRLLVHLRSCKPPPLSFGSNLKVSLIGKAGASQLASQHDMVVNQSRNHGGSIGISKTSDSSMPRSIGQSSYSNGPDISPYSSSSMTT